jgi:hypothetical protein
VKLVQWRWDARRERPLPGLATALGLSLAAATAVVGTVVVGTAASQAAVMGGARVIPFDQAVERSRLAAEAVIHRRGKETCLRGKLTNALLGLSASCEATGQRSSLCALADQAVVQTGWSMAFMDTTAHQVLELIQGPKAP